MVETKSESRKRLGDLLSHDLWPTSGRQLARRGKSLRHITRPASLIKKGNVFTQWLGWTMLRLHGWDIRGRWPDNMDTIFVVAPHTCNYDGWLGMWIQFAMRLRFSFFIKKEIFNWYLTPLVRYLGGIGVDRMNPRGIFEAACKQFKREEVFLLAITPEGTRHPPKRLKFGAWHLSKELDVPIVPVNWDYDTRTIWIEEQFDPTDTPEEWEQQLYRFFDGIRGGTGYFMGGESPNGRRLPDSDCPRPFTPGNWPLDRL